MSPRSFDVDEPKTKGAGTSSGESGARTLEAESIRSGAESTGGRVKLKTVTEIRRSSARDAFIAESVYLVLKDTYDEPEHVLKYTFNGPNRRNF